MYLDGEERRQRWTRSVKGAGVFWKNLAAGEIISDSKRDHQMEMDVQRAFTRHGASSPGSDAIAPHMVELRMQLLTLIRFFFLMNPRLCYYQVCYNVYK